MRSQVRKSTDCDHNYTDVIGYLLCGDMVSTEEVAEKSTMLADTKIYVRLYRDMLSHVERLHREFLDRYDDLQNAATNEQTSG